MRRSTVDPCGWQGMSPNLGLAELFGVKEDYVEFTPDLLKDLTFNMNGGSVYGGIFMQAYQTTCAKPLGWYQDGRIAAVENEYGRGKTILIGTFSGEAKASSRASYVHDVLSPQKVTTLSIS